VLSCQSNDAQQPSPASSTELSLNERESIKKDISGRIEEIIQGAKALNIEAALAPYSNDPEFKIVNPDATVTDFAKMKHLQTESFKLLTSMDFTTMKQDFTFLANDLVMCTWTGKNEFALKTGEKMKIEPYVGSMLFHKKENTWAIIYAHETAAPPEKIK
jgi:hypothetical protein